MENSLKSRMWDARWAVLLGICAYGGLALATGKVPLVEFPESQLPEAVRIPLYILIYSFLGGVAYLLSTLVTKYKDLSSTGRELEKEKKKLEKKKLDKEKAGVETGLLEETEEKLKEVKLRLEEFTKPKIETMDIWIKMARIPFGMLMAAAFYLLTRQLIPGDIIDTSRSELLAGCAFLVGFFPKVIMEAFSGLTKRLLGEDSSSSSDESNRGSSESIV
ncbi:MAG: hypothetical protein HXS46_02220 [Theionarchaea archaeon]|nr:hypothetical protein [Theionarchaea archaeon]